MDKERLQLILTKQISLIYTIHSLMFSKDTGYDFGFFNLKLGSTRREVKKALGKPVDLLDLGTNGIIQRYDGNVSILMDTNGRLESIKIFIDNLFSNRTNKRIHLTMPSLEYLKNVMKNKSNKELLECLSGEFEFHKNNVALCLNRSMISEENDRNSIILTEIRRFLKLIESVGNTQVEVLGDKPELWHCYIPNQVILINTKEFNAEIAFECRFKKYVISSISLDEH